MKDDERPRSSCKEPGIVWFCRCGEAFDVQVWHCPICAHHWPMWDDECGNCHLASRSRAYRARRARVGR